MIRKKNHFLRRQLTNKTNFKRKCNYFSLIKRHMLLKGSYEIINIAFYFNEVGQ